ncbi:MAG: beta-lactamase family protein, partial [Firmicutes bacterium]|nr:beta-lactamase family protein [Bacillota bacterium]
KREIFDPLGMSDTTFFSEADLTDIAMPHSKGRDRVIRLETTYPYTRQHTPSSTLKSTAADLLKWAGSLLQPAGFSDMWIPRIEVPDTGEQMGLGWFIRKQYVSTETHEAGENEKSIYTLVGHEGSDNGFRTSFWMSPELGIATVLLCNLTDAPLKKLNKKLFEKLVK